MTASLDVHILDVWFPTRTPKICEIEISGERVIAESIDGQWNIPLDFTVKDEQNCTLSLWVKNSTQELLGKCFIDVTAMVQLGELTNDISVRRKVPLSGDLFANYSGWRGNEEVGHLEALITAHNFAIYEPPAPPRYANVQRLEVVIIDAASLVAPSDRVLRPFVAVMFGGQTQVTEPKTYLSPTWNEEMSFPFSEEWTEVKFVVSHEGSKDFRCVGCASLAINNLDVNRPTVLRLPLLYPSDTGNDWVARGGSTLTVRITLLENQYIQLYTQGPTGTSTAATESNSPRKGANNGNGSDLRNGRATSGSDWLVVGGAVPFTGSVSPDNFSKEESLLLKLPNGNNGNGAVDKEVERQKQLTAQLEQMVSTFNNTAALDALRLQRQQQDMQDTTLLNSLIRNLTLTSALHQPAQPPAPIFIAPPPLPPQQPPTDMSGLAMTQAFLGLQAQMTLQQQQQQQQQEFMWRNQMNQLQEELQALQQRQQNERLLFEAEKRRLAEDMYQRGIVDSMNEVQPTLNAFDKALYEQQQHTTAMAHEYQYLLGTLAALQDENDRKVKDNTELAEAQQRLQQLAMSMQQLNSQLTVTQRQQPSTAGLNIPQGVYMVMPMKGTPNAATISQYPGAQILTAQQAAQATQQRVFMSQQQQQQQQMYQPPPQPPQINTKPAPRRPQPAASTSNANDFTTNVNTYSYKPNPPATKPSRRSQYTSLNSPVHASSAYKLPPVRLPPVETSPLVARQPVTMYA